MAAPLKQNNANTPAINLIVIAGLAKQLAAQAKRETPDYEIVKDLGERLELKAIGVLKQADKILYKENL